MSIFLVILGICVVIGLVALLDRLGTRGRRRAADDHYPCGGVINSDTDPRGDGSVDGAGGD